MATEPIQRPHPTILVADDDPLFRRLLEKYLQTWGYHVMTAADGTQAWQILQMKESSPDLLILDWLMPGVDGLELCQRVRAQPRESYQYILLVSGRDDKQDVIRGLDAGADDYLTKPLDTAELRARLRTGNRILSLQRDLIRAHEELRFQVTHDTLTGLWSRRAALDLLARELQRSSRSETSTGVLMIDLDHFKNVNDSYGHLVGDAVLKEVAARIARAVRSYDFVGRYGGEEFLAVLSNCSSQDLRAVAGRACSVVAESPVVALSLEIPVTVSIGGVVSSSRTPEFDLLSAADAALYEAKNAGRNRVVIGHSPVQQSALTKTAHSFSG